MLNIKLIKSIKVAAFTVVVLDFLSVYTKRVVKMSIKNEDC